MTGGYSQLAHEKPCRDYQKYAVNWQLDRFFTKQEMGCGLFLDPGLGKTRITLTALDYLLELGEIDRALLVAPLRPVYSVWPNEIKKWGFPHSYSILHGPMKRFKQRLAQNAKIEITNYESFKKISEMGIKNRWDFIGLDESTFIKNWNTKRRRYLHKILPTIRLRSIMTGTPASNSLADLHSQMYVTDNGATLGKTVTWFRNQYMQKGGYMGRQWILREDRKDDITTLIKDKVLTMKAEDYLDMPKLVLNNMWCEMTPAVERQYKKLKRDLYVELEAGTVVTDSQSGAYAKCKQFANGTVYNQISKTEKESLKAHDEKIHMLLELLEELAGKPLLVFYFYTQDLYRLKTYHKLFAEAPTIRGKDETGKRIKPEEVDAIIANWNTGKYPIILCQWQSASHGLNMQEACNDVACFGLIDSLEIYDQAFRRVYRQGVQGDQVRIHRLLTLRTVDELMLERLNGKWDTQDAFMKALKHHALVA